MSYESGGKPYEVLSRTAEMGRTRIAVVCPHCAEVFDAYVWSLCANGKKCPQCGAIHVGSGVAYAVVRA